MVFDCTNKSSYEYLQKEYEAIKKAQGTDIPGKEILRYAF